MVLAARVSSGQSSMGMSYELDAIAAAVIGGSSNGRSGAHYRHPDWRDDPGLIKSGFTFVGVDAYVQDIIKGIIIVAAVTIDMRRNRKNTNLINERQRRRMPLPPVLSRNKQNTPRRLRLSVLPALRILYSFATSVVHSSGHAWPAVSGVV